MAQVRGREALPYLGAEPVQDPKGQEVALQPRFQALDNPEGSRVLRAFGRVLFFLNDSHYGILNFL